MAGGPKRHKDIFGDGVNIPARLEALAEPGGICVSGRVEEDVHGKLDTVFEDIGEQQLKNIARNDQHSRRGARFGKRSSCERLRQESCAPGRQYDGNVS